jgi:GMP synthase (glutamine-hydrolysing)
VLEGSAPARARGETRPAQGGRNVDASFGAAAATLRLLVVEGNERQARESLEASTGRSASQAYADVLVAIAPDAHCDLCFPAEAGATLPDAAGLAGYDGVFITGSALNLYNGGPEVARQLELMRAIFRAQTPMFGSCWGLQLATAAAGGDVVKNPLGREIGVARNIAATAAGAAHPLLAGRPPAFDALCTHVDNVVLPSSGAVALAANAMSPVQAAEIVSSGGRFWGVQYHPEYSLGEIARLFESRAAALASEGLLRREADARAYGDELRALEADPARHDLAWRLGLDAEVVDPDRRRRELSNFIDKRVRPEKSARCRA